jgi:L-ectoine synthase
MKIIDKDDLTNTDREVKCPKGGFISRRILLESDNMGFTMTHTTVKRSGGLQFWHYKNHLEACICIEGEGEIIDINNKTLHKITPGVTYVLDKNDPHFFRALTENCILICVFNPPLKGKEIHREDGSYE